MDAAAARGRAAGLSRWMLNVKPDNVAARALYERCGLRVTFESTQMQLQWRDLTKLPLAEGVSVRPLSAADDARFEEASALSPGELSAFRPLGRMLVGAERAFAAVGVAAFDPSFPGASPFLARGRGLARPLLEAMRPGALPHHDHLFVFVEGDPPLEAELAAAGAEARLRVLRMEGEIPEMP